MAAPNKAVALFQILDIEISFSAGPPGGWEASTGLVE